jgi:O-antigen ligase
MASGKRTGHDYGRGPVVLAALFLLAPLVFWRGLHDFANLPQAALVQAAAALLLLGLLLRRVRHPGEPLRWAPPLLVPLAAFLAWALLSLSWAHHRAEGAETWLHWLACAGVFVAATDRLRSRRDRTWLLAGMACAGMAVAAIGLTQALFGFSWIPQMAPPSATLANRNMAAHVVVIALSAGLARWLTSRRRATAMAWAGGCGLSLAFLIQAGTRGAWLAGLAMAAAFVGVAVLGCRRILSRPAGRAAARRGLRRHAAPALLALGVFILLANATSAGWGGPFGQAWRRARRTAPDAVAGMQSLAAVPETGEDAAWPPPRAARKDSLILRLAVWRNAVEMVRARPWHGWGLGNVKVFYPQYRRAAVAESMTGAERTVRDLHNDWLQAAVETGLVGLALLLALAGAAARILLRQARALRNSRDAWTVVAAAGGMTACAVIACVSFPLERAIPPLLLAGYAALALAVPVRGSPLRTSILPRPILVPAACLMVLILVASVAWGGLRLDADRHFRRLAMAERQGDPLAVSAEARRVLARNPFRHEVFAFLARALLAAGDPETAAEAGEEYLRAEPLSLPGRLNLALAYGQLGRHDDAMAILAEALAQYPDAPTVRNGLGNIHLAQGRHRDALREFLAAVELSPRNARFHHNLGLAALACGLPGEAERAFHMAILLDPAWEPPYAWLHRIQPQESSDGPGNPRHIVPDPI